MKNYLNILKKYPTAVFFVLFNTLFYTAMFLSKSTHSLWFESNGYLYNYGISYSVMAFSGMFAAYIGYKVSKYNTKSVIRVGVILYSIGLFLRIFYQSSLVAAVSGFTSGIGAAVVILLLRVWVVDIGTDEERPTMLSLKLFSTDLGRALGGLFSGSLIYFLTLYFSNALEIILVIASILCLLSAFLIPDINPNKQGDSTKQKKNPNIKKLNRTLIVSIVFFGLLSGLLSSLFMPYLPVILKRQHVPISMIGILLTLMGASGTIFSSLFSGDRTNSKKGLYYLFSEILIGIITFLFIFQLHLYFIVFLLIFRVFVSRLSMISSQLMELEIFPKDSLAQFYGMAQTSFFIGDSLGGMLSGIIYNFDMNLGTSIFSILIGIEAISFYYFYNRMLQKIHY